MVLVEKDLNTQLYYALFAIFNWFAYIYAVYNTSLEIMLVAPYDLGFKPVWGVCSFLSALKVYVLCF